jgi:MFS family permease
MPYDPAVTNTYLLALAVSLITVGKLGDRFGHKLLFLIGVARLHAQLGGHRLLDWPDEGSALGGRLGA